MVKRLENKLEYANVVGSTPAQGNVNILTIFMCSCSDNKQVQWFMINTTLISKLSVSTYTGFDEASL